MQVFLNLQAWLFAHELRHHLSNRTSGWIVNQRNLDPRAAVAGDGLKTYRTGVFDFRSRQRAPCNKFALTLVNDFRIPFDAGTAKRFDYPMAFLVTKNLDGFDVLHEARQVRKIAPVSKKLRCRFLDDDAFLHLGSRLAVQRGAVRVRSI